MSKSYLENAFYFYPPPPSSYLSLSLFYPLHLGRPTAQRGGREETSIYFVLRDSGIPTFILVSSTVTYESTSKPPPVPQLVTSAESENKPTWGDGPASQPSQNFSSLLALRSSSAPPLVMLAQRSAGLPFGMTSHLARPPASPLIASHTRDSSNRKSFRTASHEVLHHSSKRLIIPRKNRRFSHVVPRSRVRGRNRDTSRRQKENPKKTIPGDARNLDRHHAPAHPQPGTASPQEVLSRCSLVRYHASAASLVNDPLRTLTALYRANLPIAGE